MCLLHTTIDYVNNIFDDNPVGIQHFERTLFWFKERHPDTTLAMQIAAYGHDLERWFREPGKLVPENYLDPAFLEYHQTKGADLLCEFLEKEWADEETLRVVRHLVEKHEVWGDELQNILRDADSMSFLETSGNRFVDVKYTEGYEKVKEKIDRMYERIGNPSVKEKARELYEPLMERLKNRCNQPL